MGKIENTAAEKEQIAAIEARIAELNEKFRITGVENWNDSREILQLMAEKKAIREAASQRWQWEQRAKVDPAYNRELIPPVPAPAPRKSDYELTLPEWLNRYRQRYQELTTSAANNDYVIGTRQTDPLSPKDRAFVIDYSQKQRHYNSGAWQAEQNRRAAITSQRERQAEHAAISAGIAADHQSVHDNFQRLLGLEQDYTVKPGRD